MLLLLFPSSIAALVATLLLSGVVSLRSDGDEKNKESVNGYPMRFDGAFYKQVPGTVMKLSRQGVQLYNGKPVLYNFSTSDFHKEFVVTFNPPDGKAPCNEAIFVSGETMPGLCSTGLFSRSMLYCDAAKGNFQPQLKQYEDLEPRSDRGFGLEMEFVSREPSSSLLNLCRKQLQRNLDNDGDIEKYLGTSRGKVYAVRLCTRNITKSSKNPKSCDDDIDCPLADYCLDCSKCTGTSDDCYPCEDRSKKMCSPRTYCKPEYSGRSCPMPLSRWNWMTDSSVVPLSRDEAGALGVDFDQTVGYSFEVTSPAPPHVLSGKQGFNSGVELLTLLKGMGIQAGPSQGMHVHINALNKNAPGTMLEHEGIIAIWMAYAKYQLVIDEMLSPGRIGNRYANPLFLGDCEPNDGKTTCDKNPCGCNRRFFNQMHEWHLKVDRHGESRDTLSFCNFVLKIPGTQKSEEPCQSRYPHQRYSQLNLVPIHKFGTVEFRGHSATYSVTRVMRWTQFLVAFVEHFGHGQGAREILSAFAKNSAEQDYRNLQRQQQEATFEDLFNDLKYLVDPETMNYYATRKWENGDTSCAQPQTPQVRVLKNCLPGEEEDRHFVHAKFQERTGSEVKMTIKIPRLTKQQVPFSNLKDIQWYISVLMPEGYSWKVIVKAEFDQMFGVYIPLDAEFYAENLKLERVAGNVFSFTYNPDMIERDFEEDALEQHHRCCCIDQKCLWYSEDLLHKNHCPSFEKTEGQEMCLTNKPCNFFTKLTNPGCVKASHSRRRNGPTLCSLTRDTHTFFEGVRCDH